MKKMKVFILVFLFISAVLPGCNSKSMEAAESVTVAQRHEQVITETSGTEQEKKISELTQEKAIQRIRDMDSDMKKLQDRLLLRERISEEEGDEVLHRYFSEELAEYASAVYGMEKQNDAFIYNGDDFNNRFSILIEEPMKMTASGVNFCEVEVVFGIRWKKGWETEAVPVRLEYQEDAWRITGMSQWYNDFRYRYMPDGDFLPEYFTSEMAEDMAAGFGTDEKGNTVSLEVTTDENGYILAGSRERILTEEEIKGLTRYESYLAIQEIYAQHGKKFRDVAAAQYFFGRSWYRPYEQLFTVENLTEIEKSNIELLAERGRLTEEAEPDYGNLYPISERKENMLSAEEAVMVVIHAFDMADAVITPKEENYKPEEDEDIFRYYSLGEYSEKERLQEYLSQWFSAEVYDYVLSIYRYTMGLTVNADGEYRYIMEGTPAGFWQEIDERQPVEILAESENECRIKIPYVNYQVAWVESPERSSGEVVLKKQGDRWLISEMTQSYYDELIREMKY